MSLPPPHDPAFVAWLRAQEELAQLVAHDMRNPLQAILANASFLDDSFHPNDREARETASDIRTSAEVLLRLIENSVTIARLENPASAAIELSAVSLRTTAESAIERCAAMITGSEISLHLDPGDDARVMADPGLLELLIFNMLTNAIQHSRRKNVITLRLEREGARAAVTLIDMGPPFGAYEQHFTRDAQLAIKFDSRGRYSRGLGLYVMGLVSRAFGGTIEPAVDGPRSVLRVWLPVAP